MQKKKSLFKQIKTGKPDTLTPITYDIINSISKIRMFESKRNDEGVNVYLNNALLDKHREVLKTSMLKNKNREVGILWKYTDVSSTTYVKVLGGMNFVPLNENEDARNLLKYSERNTLIFMHNHPRNTPFSGADLSSFAKFKAIYAMTAVCNDGTIHMLRKRGDFDGEKMLMEYNKWAKGKHGDFTAIKMIAKKARFLGLTYRCSVKRRSK